MITVVRGGVTVTPSSKATLPSGGANPNSHKQMLKDHTAHSKHTVKISKSHAHSYEHK